MVRSRFFAYVVVSRDRTARPISSVERERPSLFFMITVMDRDGHVLGRAACHPDDYERRL